ncbi:hypothetical protein PIB30_109939, partial [Stylosanthes scabra]|nr:hypothetical protein [Stylosanthes scabra]
VTKPILCTHRHRRPRICVVDQQAHIPSHVYTTSNVTPTSPSFTHPRICVENTLAASNFTRPTHRRGSPCICMESSHKSRSRVKSSRAQT